MQMTVTRINVTPVKGTRITEAGEAILGPDGVHTNRRFYFINEKGVMVNGKLTGELTRVRSSYDADRNRLAFTLPDGVVVEDFVHLTDEVVETNFYGRPVYGQVVDGPWADTASTLTGDKLRMVKALPGITATDVYPVTLISADTLAFIKKNAGGPDDQWNDRFRMLMEIAAGEEFIEDSWIGSELSIGDAVVRAVGPVPRCVVTTRNPSTGEPDFKTLHALRQIRGENLSKLATPTEHLPDGGKLLLGVYAEVVRPGRVWTGCTVSVGSSAPAGAASEPAAVVS